MTARRGWWIAAGGVALAFRVALVVSWHSAAGDTLQYYALVEELITHHRFAFRPEPAPLAWTRLPGYPLFVAFLVTPHPVPLEVHVERTTLWNAMLDVGSALVVARMLVEMGRRAAARYGFAATVLCPVLMFLSTCALTESLATFLAAVESLCILRIVRGEHTARNAAILGCVAGCAQLTRADALFLWPALAVALFLGSPRWRPRWIGALAFAGALAIVFAPWPLRNSLRFGSPHPLGTHWIRGDGAPRPTGMRAWMRSWSSSRPGEAFIELPLLNDNPLDVHRPGIVQPSMYDDENERSRVVALFQEYNRTRLTPDLDQEFAALAAERARRAPFRAWFVLPVLRAFAEWQPLPEYEISAKVPWLGLPSMRPAFGRFERVLLGLAMVGAVVLWRAGEKRTVATLLCAIAARTALPAIVHPFPVERYLVEAFPAILALTGVGAASLVESFRLRGSGEEAAKPS